MWVVGEVTENPQRAKPAALFPLRNPQHTASQGSDMGCPALMNPLLPNRCARQKKMAQMKEQFKAPENIQLSNEEIGNLSDAQFKTLVIRMLQELTGYFNSIQKTHVTMKVALCEIKKNLQQTNSDGKGTRVKSTVWTRKKKETFNQNRMKKQEFKKMRRGLGTPMTSLNVPTSES